MNTFLTTLKLKGRKREIEVDYTLYTGACAVYEGGLALVPKETTSVEIRHIRAKLRGHWFGYADRLTDDQWKELESRILESVQEGL